MHTGCDRRSEAGIAGDDEGEASGAGEARDLAREGGAARCSVVPEHDPGEAERQPGDRG
jgi:hypothetical protein